MASFKLWVRDEPTAGRPAKKRRVQFTDEKGGVRGPTGLHISPGREDGRRTREEGRGKREANVAKQM